MTTPSTRRDPQPLHQGWELAGVLAAGLLICLSLAALTGLGVASSLWGGGWVWPHGTQTMAGVLSGILHGHPGDGLPPDLRGRVASIAPVYVCVVGCELLLLAAGAAAAVLVTRYRRPGDARRGMATRREAADALGIRRLRAAGPLIRPDLYGPDVEVPTLPALVHRLGDAVAAVHRSARSGIPQQSAAGALAAGGAAVGSVVEPSRSPA